jgi:hypothetical protein
MLQLSYAHFSIKMSKRILVVKILKGFLGFGNNKNP